MSVDSASGCGIGPGSKRVTSCPRRHSSIAVERPKMPPPITTAFAVTRAYYPSMSPNEATCLLVCKVIAVDGVMTEDEKGFLGGLMSRLDLDDAQRKRVMK